MSHTILCKIMQIATLLSTLVLIAACGGGDDAQPGMEDGMSNQPSNNAASNATSSNTLSSNQTSNMATTSNATTGTTPGSTTGSPTTGAGLMVPAHARACELVLDDPDGVVSGFEFGDTVTGKAKRRGRHLAVAFYAMSDHDIHTDAVVPVWEGDTQTMPTVALAHCYDRLGHPLEDAITTLP